MLREAAAGYVKSAASKDKWMLDARVKNMEEMRGALEEAMGRVGEKRKGILVEISM